MQAWRDGKPYHNKKMRKIHTLHVGISVDFGMPQR
jgi:hypothetical protein